jgi:hypothetical protein
LLQVTCLEHVLDQPQEAVVVDLVAEDRQQDVVVYIVETTFDITLDGPLRALPVPGDVLQCGVTAQPGSETVGMGVELRLVVGLQEAAYDFLQQFVGPSRHAEGAHLPVGFRDEHPPDRGPAVAFMTDVVDERLDLLQG